MEQRQVRADERRAHPRLSLDHPGILTLKGSRARSCRLRDVCPGGLHLEVPRPAWSGRAGQAPPLAEPGDAALLRLVVGTGSEARAFEVQLRVARVFEGGMGVAFVAPYPGVVRALQQVAARRATSRVTRAPALMEAVRGAYRKALDEQVEPRLTALLADIGTPLVQAACAAAGNGEQARFLDAVPVLEEARDVIVHEVLARLLERVAEFGTRPTEPPDGLDGAPLDGEADTEVSLAELDDFEDFLVVAELVTTAESLFETPLRELEERLGQARGTPLTRDESPVGTACTCHAFRDAIRGYRLHRDARRVLYRELDRQVVSVFGELYAAINHELERLGIGRAPGPGSARPGVHGPLAAGPPAGRHTEASSAGAGNGGEPALASMTGQHRRLVDRATHDAVTGLANARHFHGVVAQALTRAIQEQVEHLLLHVAPDNHAAVLDDAGQAAADELLRAAAATLARGAGDGADVARLGGGALGVLLPDCRVDDARATAERLCRDLAETGVGCDGGSRGAAASIGLAVISKRAPDADSVLDAARAAAAAARAAGGARVMMTHRNDPARRGGGPMMDRVPLLNRTLRDDRPCFRWQRIVPLIDDRGTLPMYEILLGVRDEDGRSVSPQALLQAAVYYQHMPALDRWVVRNALAWMAAKPGRLAEVGAFAINLAGQSLADDRLAGFVAEELLASGVPPAKLCFELSEAAVLANPASATDLMLALRTRGCRFTLADAGPGLDTGLLHRLPFEMVKIAGQFVRNIATSAEDLAVVRSTHEIARFTGRQTIAECVEDADTLRALCEIGVDFAQGFAIDRPRQVDDDTPAPAEVSLEDTLEARAPSALRAG